MTRCPHVLPAQRGSSLLLVLVLLTVAVLGALMLVRLSESGAALTGNVAYRESAIEAAETGAAEAFTKVQALSTAQVEANAGSWYYAIRLGDDAKGLPQGVVWASANAVTVGSYTVRYVVERMCTGSLPVPDVQQSCLTVVPALGGSAKAGAEVLDAAPQTQYRTTLQTTGPKNTLVYTQGAFSR